MTNKKSDKQEDEQEVSNKSLDSVVLEMDLIA